MAVKNYVSLFGTTYDLADGANLAQSVETTSTAVAAHATGSHFLYNGIVYCATADIAVGDTIEPDTNCTRVRVADKLGALEDDFLTRIGKASYTITDMSAYTPASGIISTNTNTASQWSNTSSDNYKHIYIPIEKGGGTLTVVRGTSTAVLGVVRSYSTPVAGEYPDYSTATGFTGRITVGTADERKTWTLPNDAKGIIVNVLNNSSENCKPTSISIVIPATNGDVVTELKEAEADITGLAAADTALDRRLTKLDGFVNYGFTPAYEATVTGGSSTAAFSLTGTRSGTVLTLTGDCGTSDTGLKLSLNGGSTLRVTGSSVGALGQVALTLKDGHTYRLRQHVISGTSTGENIPRWTAVGSIQPLDGTSYTVDVNGDIYSDVTYSAETHTDGLCMTLFIRRDDGNVFTDWAAEFTVTDLTEAPRVYEIEKIVKAQGLTSPYIKKNVHFGCIPSDWYSCSHEGHYSSLDKDSTSTEVIAAFDALIDGHELYVTKSLLKTEDNIETSLALYDFNPVTLVSGASGTNPSGILMKDRPTVIVTCTHHGGERSAAFGWYEIAYDLLNNWSASPIMAYLRKHVRILLVPMVNAYGFDHSGARTNENGVDLNRNYSAGWSETYSDPHYNPGEAPFDQVETQAIKKLMDDHPEAVLFVDNHMQVGSTISSLKQINWISVQDSADVLYGDVVSAGAYHLAALTQEFCVKYSLAQTEDVPVFGRITSDPAKGTSRDYALSKNIAAVTVEGFGAFLSNPTALYTDAVKQANAEISANAIMAMLNALDK